jgi:hypothetical protein
MSKLSELKGACEGRTVAVLCGGPDTFQQSQKLPGDSVLISVNAHAALLFNCDYIVFNDAHNTTTGEEWGDILLDRPGVRVSIIKHLSEVEDDVGLWDAGFSAGTATWFACHLGGAPVVLCGADCYTSDRDYFWNKPGEYPRRDHFGAESLQHNSPLEGHLKAWAKCLEHCPDADRIRAGGPPLLNRVFPPYGVNGVRVNV